MTYYFIIYLFKRELIMEKIALVGILLFCLLFLSCVKEEKKGYPIEIKKVDNVIYINNPGFPKTPVKEFTLKQELSIGNEDDDDYIFVKVRKLAVDDQDNIYVLDRGKCQVKVFDKHGTYIRSFGRKGQGPGEFLSPKDLIVDEKNKTIHILDYGNRKIVRYHFNGTFDSELKLKKGGPLCFFMDPDRFYLVRYSFINDHGDWYYKIIKYNLDGKILLQSEEFTHPKYNTVEYGGLVISAPLPFEPRAYFTCDSKSNLYFGFSDKYKIIAFDTAFNKLKVIQKNNPELIKVSKEDKDNFINELKEALKKKGLPHGPVLKRIKFPEYHPIFDGIWINDKDRVLVQSPSKDDMVHIDVFNSKGVYVEKMIINKPSDGISLDYVFGKPVFKDEYIYTAVEDKNGIPLIKKYRIKEK